ncbi:glycosyltransferase family 2 protein [Halostella sp. JP-L12]|uniref:glycosyltransferase n=1 Tax=Halostella TaxID=1843185 RepID=UPI000EF81D4D|nr:MULTISPECIES: glycosyltransferase family 2 protein [Halostella]NHN49897.1 glycosyltransferase family 2 protein [Halostella sp. JP-L12]
MEVETPSSADGSSTATYAALAGGIALLFLALALAVPAAANALTVIGTALLAGIAARALWSSLLAVRSPTPPDPPTEWPSVSVVVTAYNEADALRDCVAACRALEYPGEVETVLCYESASTDGTARVAEGAARRHDRVTAVRRNAPPGGKAAAVNHALDHASGEVVASIDANQRPDPAMLRRGVRWFRDADVRCVKGRCYGTNATDSLVALHATVERHLLERAEFYARDVFGGFTLFTGGQVLFRAGLVDDLGPFDESVLIEDVDMACRVHQAGDDVRVDPGVVTYENNPATLDAWLSQRKRWARGALQVARRHTLAMLRSPRVSPVTKLDAAFTFGYVLVAPLLILALPALWIAAPPFRDAPLAAALRLSPAAAGLVAAAVVFALDYVADRSHAHREYAAPLTLWAYAALQCTVVVTAFLDEFVLDAPVTYVTSSTEDAGASSDD